MKETRLNLTTDLGIVRDFRHLFTWGKVERVHDIGRHTIVEHDERAMNSRDLTGNVRFHVYVDGKDACTSAATLDGALLLAIGIAHLGENNGGHAARFMARALGIKEEA